VRPTISDPGRFALKNAVRAAIVVPAAFAVGLEVAGLPQMALFGAFGAIGFLVFVDFGGTRAVRLAAYVALLLAGTLTIPLGTLPVRIVRISASGSSAVTWCPAASSVAVSLPVPAPRSSTSSGPAPSAHSIASAGRPGRPRS
jgi:hypothetical protein